MEKVIMYTLSTCPWCRKTKQWFKDHNIEFEFVDYDLATDDVKKRIQEKVRSDELALSFPIVYIGRSVVQGHNPDKYAALLKQ